MKNIACITFHSSYNFGSNLQAYALQEYIKKTGLSNVNYKILNFRTDKQRKMYDNFFENYGIKNYLKRILFFKYKKDIYKRAENYEQFINEKLDLTKELKTREELIEESIKFDYFIAGSDQIWNPNAYDFEWEYFLDFTENPNKISYAASLGPSKSKLTEQQSRTIKSNIKNFKNISVREKGSKDKIIGLTKNNISVNIDPTLLLKKDDWEKIIDKRRIINEKYILLYDLSGDKEKIRLAKKISKELDMPIVIPKTQNPKLLFVSKGFVKKYDTGPLEFLNLVKNAEIVLSSSFHGTVFSIILNKPFFAINGLSDNRIKNLLEMTELSSRALDSNNYKSVINNAKKINYEKIDKLLDIEREKSKKYLIENLDL